ncbi:MAG: ATP-binding protein, partial [Promethearchaeota archaeon]
MMQNFPFSAILGQEIMQKAILVNIIDPIIGGVLLSGEQGTGKSITVRSLVDIVPKIEIFHKCQFHCRPNEPKTWCADCVQKYRDIFYKNPQKIMKYLETVPISLVTLPLGCSEDMLLGSLNLEELLQNGEKIIQPGLFAQAHRGILYVDEINLLPDHLVDLLIDVSSSGINFIEREGISMSHPADFVLIGSMNPEEGELRPQIRDRLGIEVEVKASRDPNIRAEINKRVIDFEEHPDEFIARYQNSQILLKNQIQKARNKLNSIKLLPFHFKFASELTNRLHILSQRADLIFLRTARALSAFYDHSSVEKDDLSEAMYLVFNIRVKKSYPEFDSKFLGMTFDEIWHKLRPSFEDIQLHSDMKPEMKIANTFKSSPKIKDKYKENPLREDDPDLPEVEEGHRKSDDRYSNYDLDDTPKTGYKVGDNDTYQKQKALNPIEIPFYQTKSPVQVNLEPIFSLFNQYRKIVAYTGRGTRVRILSHSSGRYVFPRKPKGKPHSIAFLHSIKSHLLNNQKTILDREPQSIKISLDPDDLYEKVNELHAPLSLYFIVDASASVRR